MWGRMVWMLAVVWVLSGAWGTGQEAQAAPGRRVALVIGNAAYSVRPLSHPLRDAEAMRDLLARLGFDPVLFRPDLQTKNDMREAVRQFLDNSRQAEVRLFYFAGHGVNYRHESYLLPLNHNIGQSHEIPDDGYPLNSLLRGMRDLSQQREAVNIVLLDACRDNPFGEENYSIGDEYHGLGEVNPMGGIVVAYAAGEGERAIGQAGERNSLFTKHLLRNLNQPVSLMDALAQVTGAVHGENPRQLPQVHTQLTRPGFSLVERQGRTRQPLEVFRDPLRDGTLGPAMVVIPAGEFKMGSPSGEVGREPGDAREQQHPVKIERAFALGQYEATVGEFKRFADASGYQTDAERDPKNGCYVWNATDGQRDWRTGLSWRKPGYEQKDNHPVVCVSWNDANRYAEWLSQQTGQTYQLPIEAEWEYAARVGTTTARYWGESPNQACRYANVADRTVKQMVSDWTIHDCQDGYAYTAPVSSFEANAWGLKDMLGNVWEWTCSAYAQDYDGSEAECYHKDTTDLLALRGGGQAHPWQQSERLVEHQRERAATTQWVRARRGYRVNTLVATGQAAAVNL